MNFEIYWHWLLALPALLLPGVNTLATSQVTSATPSREVRMSTQRQHIRKSEPVRQASPTPAPVATTSLTPIAGQATSELASEQVCPGQGDVAKTTVVLPCLTSNARLFHGLGSVKGDGALMAAASAKAADMLKCGYGHTACGRDFNYWIVNKGYAGRCTGENIAQGQLTAREVFVAWMNSAGHRANIMNKDYRDIGVAELASSKGPLWVMELGGC